MSGLIGTKVKILDFWPDVGGYGVGRSVTFDYNDVPLRYERWATEDTSGCDIYVDGGNSPAALDNEDELMEYLDRVLEIYDRHHGRLVNPALEEAVRATKYEVSISDEAFQG